MAARTRTRNILVVDDDVGVRDAFHGLLTEAGHKVLVAAEASAADRIVHRHRIDLALVDIWLSPGIDGIALIKKWRDDGVLNFPLAVISGHAEVNTAVQAMRFGAINVLTKPVPSKVLLDFVDKALATEHVQTNESWLARANLGAAKKAVALKGRLLQIARTDGPVVFVGAPHDGCEFFALLLHAAGRPWREISDLGFLGENPQRPLAEMDLGTLFVRGVDALEDPRMRRGLSMLLRNAPASNVRVLVESRQPLAALKAAGTLEDEAHALFEGIEVEVPPLAEYESSHDEIVAEACRLYPLALGLPADAFSPKAIKVLCELKARWVKLGLGRMLEMVRGLMAASPNGRVDEELARRFMDPDTVSVSMEMDLFELKYRDARLAFEKVYIDHLLERVNYNYSEAARVADMERSYIYKVARKSKGNLSKKNKGDEDG